MASTLLTFEKRHFALPEVLTLHADQGSCSYRILQWKLSSTTHLCGPP